MIKDETLKEFDDYLVLSKPKLTKLSSNWDYRILPENSQEIKKSIKEGYIVSKKKFKDFKYKDRFSRKAILESMTVFRLEDSVKTYLGKGTIKKIEETKGKIFYGILLDKSSKASSEYFKQGSLVFIEAKGLTKINTKESSND